MDKNQNNKVNNGGSVKRPAPHNDQVGENASEEYASENYMNAPKEAGNPKKKS